MGGFDEFSIDVGKTAYILKDLFECFGAGHQKQRLAIFAEKLKRVDYDRLKKVVNEMQATRGTMPQLSDIINALGSAANFGNRNDDIPMDGEELREMYDRKFKEAYKKLHGIEYVEEKPELTITEIENPNWRVNGGAMFNLTEEELEMVLK